ncbi:MAG: polyamine aminopropyltransferase [Chitinophagaceae bacterium]|nr:MAG: polyamine aminopropyltransferase [Chitinophagaceae bacterium]
MPEKKESGQWILLIAVFAIATCGLVYELVAGTLASYMLGDSVTQFSTIIGAYLFSMGIGSFLSKYINGNLLAWFIKIELLVGVVGGFSAAILFVLFPLVESFRLVLYAFVAITGILVGLEIPLLMRILQNKVEFKDLVSRVFTFDYIGALLASLVFPLIFVPHLGLIKTSLFFGILNTAVGFYVCYYFRQYLGQARYLRFLCAIIIFIQVIGFVFSEKIMDYAERQSFSDDIVFANSTPYQRIVITRNKKETRLFLNGNLQFSSADEYRYHEALVHPALSSIINPRKILVLGGGDGLAVREILKYPGIQSITLVDLDPAMTRIFSKQERLLQLNHRSLLDKKVTVINADAFTWMMKNQAAFDAVIVDFPDPSNFSIGKLYSNSFYKLLNRSLTPDGIAVVQSTSPFVAPKSFWCVNSTLQSAGLQTVPYHNFVPSFGEWGYIMAMKSTNRDWYKNIPANLRFVNKPAVETMLFFSEDMKPRDSIQINKLNNQALVHYFEEEWNKYLDI